MAKQKYLVIVESPSKAHTIGKILGADFKVMASVGHIRDLKKHFLSVNVKKNFEPIYEVPEDKKKIVADLCKAALQADVIYLASDPDREGEAIAWHLKQVLSESDALNEEKPFLRVQYNEVTERAVRAAIESPGEIDQARVDAQQARRVLDRLVGYKVSPLVRNSVEGGQSAGRVQSVALRVVCDREREILQFIPEAYWIMGAELSHKGTQFTTRLARVDDKKPIINTEELAQCYSNELNQVKQLTVSAVKLQNRQKKPYPPFRTSTLQQSASSVCGFSPSRTMSLAQKLYEAGLITYMRTDSSAIAHDAQTAASKYLIDTFGKAYVPEKPPVYGSRKEAQGAHEAIRPTDINQTPKALSALSAPELKLYDLIWKRFAASQMKPAKLVQRSVEFAPLGVKLDHTYTLSASKTDVAFEGFYKIMKPATKARKVEDAENADEESDEIATLPMMDEGSLIDLVKWLSERKETAPPPRFNEASLIKVLEEDGVGRPSTYASIVETLDKRKYVSRENRQMIPTDAGLKVADFLVAQMEPMVNVGFTAKMEEDLDRIEAKEITWTELMTTFYAKLSQWLKADPKLLELLFKHFEQVTQWSDPVTKGKRVYDDQKLVGEMREAMTTDTGVTKSQFGMLVSMAVRYREQMPEFEEDMTRMGVRLPVPTPKIEDALMQARFDALEAIELGSFEAKFITSLKNQWGNGRPLSFKQLAALDKALLRNARAIPNFEDCAKLIGMDYDANAMENVSEDLCSRDLIEASNHITQWDEPTKKGKRVYDDAGFCQSLSSQFATKKALSEAQRRALGVVLAKYASQIPNFAELAKLYNIKQRKVAADKKPPQA